MISHQLFEKIYNQHYAGLYYFAKRYVGEQKEAEDIVAESFIKLWRAEGTFEGEQSIKAFLYIVTRNGALDHLRATSKQGLIKDEYFFLFSQDHVTTMQEDDIKAAVLRTLLESVDQLPPKCRKIFKMGYLEGYSNEQISKLLGLSYQTVKNQKVRGLKMLKDRFAGIDVFLSFLLIFQWLFV